MKKLLTITLLLMLLTACEEKKPKQEVEPKYKVGDKVCLMNKEAMIKHVMYFGKYSYTLLLTNNIGQIYETEWVGEELIKKDCTSN